MLEEEQHSIKKFQEYIRISEEDPIKNYDKCINFLNEYAKELSLQIQIVTSKNIQKTVIISLKGQNPQLASILLSTQIDVAPVCKDQWKRDPFAAEIDEEGNIYGRGTQGAKCIGVQYLEVVRKLKNSKKRILRTVHVIFLPDTGIGEDSPSMKKFIHNFVYKQFRVGFVIDKGHPSPDDHYVYFKKERAIWQLEIKCPGLPTSRSTLSDDTAGQKVLYLLKKIYEFRDGEIKKLNKNPELSLGDVTTLNVTMLKVGYNNRLITGFFTTYRRFKPLSSAVSHICKIQCFQMIFKISWFKPSISCEETKHKLFKFEVNKTNLQGEAQVNTLPSVLTIALDSRIAVTADMKKFEENLNKWCREAGKGIKIKNSYKSSASSLTDIDESNLYWVAFQKALHSKNRKSKQKVLPGNSNLRYLREVGVPVIGFSPIVNTPILAQCADEYLNSEVFLNGIKLYHEIMLEVANVP